MKNLTDERFAQKKTFADASKGLKLPEAFEVGTRISFDLVGGSVHIETSVFASKEAFEAGAEALRTEGYTIQGAEFDDLDKKSKTLFHALKNLFLLAEEKRTKQAARQNDEMSERQREKMSEITKQIEAAGGKVVFPEDKEKKDK